MSKAGRPREIAKVGSVQVAIRVDPTWVENADALAERMSRPGMNFTRADALRMALAEGLALLMRKEGLTKGK